jgi:carboxylesterase type B
VTINYRLGALGYLSLGTKEVPGNAGMKDQVMALKWVQKNIQRFGGNKNLVTLFGQSAGGMSISAHLASQMSANLFHRAIILSGSITVPFKLRGNNRKSIENYYHQMNCSSGHISKFLFEVKSLNFVETLTVGVSFRLILLRSIKSSNAKKTCCLCSFAGFP